MRKRENIAVSASISAFLLATVLLLQQEPIVGAAASPHALLQSQQTAVLSLSILKADRAARVIRQIFPHVSVRVDRESNSVIVLADADEMNAIRNTLTALDIRSPSSLQTQVLAVTPGSADDLAKRIRSLFVGARVSTHQGRMLIVTSTAEEFAQIRAIVSAIDTPATPQPSSEPVPGVAFPISQANPALVARAVERALPRTQVLVAGSTIIVRGSPEQLEAVKPLLAQIDRPPTNVPYPAVYRPKSVDATSVADLLTRSFPSLTFVVTKEINAISVNATTFQHARIADAITQLDDTSTATSAQGANVPYPGESDFEVISLRAAVPSSATNGSSSANDIATTVSQALAASAPDLKITVQPNSTRLILTGSQRSRDLGKKLIAQLDVADPLVELDTRVLEVDEGAQSQLGLKFPTPVLGTTYSETTPTSATGTDDRLLRLQPLTRTPLTLEAQLDFLVSNNQAKILEDPRITTFSGRTATLRAGETVNILTTAGGGSGTVATTQIQSFQTGVTLDITPVVNADNYITVTLHPSINSIAGIGTSGVPDIQTRDTTTTIGLQDGETLIIGGLIEETDTKTVSKIPILGDLPLIGRLFQDVGTNHARNELVVTVTPHVLKRGDAGSVYHLSMVPDLPKISATATLPPITTTSAPRSAEVVTSTAAPVLSPPASIASSAPSSLPTAFNQTNAFVYGAAPTNNFAGDDQPPQIFYVRAQPTVVKAGTPVTISVLTTSNVQTLYFGPTPGSQRAALTSVGAGKWQSTITFDPVNLPSTTGNVSETLTATTRQGTTTVVRVPFTLTP